MPSMFESRFNSYVIPAIERAFGVTVRLGRGAMISGEITARRNDREYTTLGAELGIETKITMRDFLLPAESVLIDGDRIEPKTGDRIIEGDEIFEIQPADKNKPSVELQAGASDWLVHTKKVS